MRFVRLPFALTLLFVLTGCPSPVIPIDPTGPVRAWTAGPLERVGLESAPGPSRNAELFAARGESEAFQVVLTGDRGVKGASLEVSDLRGPNGAVIGGQNISLYRQHYVQITDPSPSFAGSPNRSQGPGWYADALIPFSDPSTGRPLSGGRFQAVPVDVQPGRNQPFWVEVSVPRNAAAGRYLGSYRLSSVNGTLEGQISLTVWNFELPLRPSVQSFFPLWNLKTRAARAELLRNRLMPGRVEPAEVREFADRYGMNYIDLGIWSGANAETCRARSAPSVAEFQAASQARQVGVPVYNFAFDELDVCDQRGINLLPDIRNWSRNMRVAGVGHMSTLHPRRELLEGESGRPLVDIFSVNAEMYSEAQRSGLLEAARQRGSSFWYYTALINRDTPYAPQWLLDYSPMNFRVSSGVLLYNLGLTGFFGWAADYYDASWQRRQDPWTDVRYFNANRAFNGDGLWFYPGDAVGMPTSLVPSLRVKWLRDGIEDYEYLRLIRERGLSIRLGTAAEELARSMADWEKNPARLEAVRRQMGELLNR
ncbi:MAG: DUF4091 domain-containing protein [Meiothermus sp.]|nr:DUF4091 domain-containing protein [Meiothermus sp.]